MLHSSTQKLIQKLCDLTAAGNIAWRDDEHDRVVFETEGYIVEAGANPPSIRLLRTDGAELESASEADLASTPWPDGNGTYATHVSEMVKRAQRIARGAEQAISKILSSLSAPPLKAVEPEFEPAGTRAPPEPEPPPASHSVAEAPPDSTIQPPHTETAIAAVLAAAPAVEESISEPAIESAPVEPEAEITVAAAEEELPLEEAPLPEPPAKVETAPVTKTPAPEPKIATTAATRLFAATSFEPERPKPALARSQFGETPSFARPAIQKPAPAPKPATPEPVAPEPVAKVTSTGLFITGFSAVTRQTVRGELPSERPEPAPQPAPAPVAQAPAPKPEPPPAPRPEPPAPKPRPEPIAAAGHEIYKPWA